MTKSTKPKDDKETVTYLKAYNIASNLINKSYKQMSLIELQKELKRKKIRVPLTVLSQVKNKKLPHQYPETIRKILMFYGYKKVTVSRKILVTFQIPDKESKD